MTKNYSTTTAINPSSFVVSITFSEAHSQQRTHSTSVELLALDSKFYRAHNH